MGMEEAKKGCNGEVSMCAEGKISKVIFESLVVYPSARVDCSLFYIFCSLLWRNPLWLLRFDLLALCLRLYC